MPSGRVYAIIPAAGHSRRMGRPKLLLPIGQQTVIGRLLAVLDSPRIAERLVVMRQDDTDLADAVRSDNATVIQPETDPPDMRYSVEAALSVIANRHTPTANDAWLLIPADYPMVQRQTADALLDAWSQTAAKILIPKHDGRRGHPVIFSWTLAERVPSISADRGLNTLVHEFAEHIEEVPVTDPAIRLDMDTPEDYARLQNFKAE